MSINYDKICSALVGKKINRPNITGTLSGHAAGEPFEKFVYAELLKDHPKTVFKQFEYLNTLYQNNPSAKTVEDRHNLIESQALRDLVNRGKSVTEKWSNNNLFVEKQNDTADIIIDGDDIFTLLDVKTRNNSKNAQPPNIISSRKLAHACKAAIENKEYDKFEFSYIEIDWVENKQTNELICVEAHHANLFKEIPSNLYINWAAALQIQFHVKDLEQDFKGTNEEWMREYLKHFVNSAENRINRMKKEYIDDFIDFI